MQTHPASIQTDLQPLAFLVNTKPAMSSSCDFAQEPDDETHGETRLAGRCPGAAHGRENAACWFQERCENAAGLGSVRTAASRRGGQSRRALGSRATAPASNLWSRYSSYAEPAPRAATRQAPRAGQPRVRTHDPTNDRTSRPPSQAKPHLGGTSLFHVKHKYADVLMNIPVQFPTLH